MTRSTPAPTSQVDPTASWGETRRSRPKAGWLPTRLPTANCRCTTQEPTARCTTGYIPVTGGTVPSTPAEPRCPPAALQHPGAYGDDQPPSSAMLHTPDVTVRRGGSQPRHVRRLRTRPSHRRVSRRQRSCNCGVRASLLSTECANSRPTPTGTTSSFLPTTPQLRWVAQITHRPGAGRVMCVRGQVLSSSSMRMALPRRTS
jgi:hypothetical protein